MMFGYIYKTTILNKDSKLYKCFYIGQHKASTYNKKYFGSGKIISRYIRKYGKALLKNEILVKCYSKEALDKAEIHEIAKYYDKNAKCLNIAKGGEGGNNIKWTRKRRKQQSESVRQSYVKDSTLRERVAHRGKQNGMYGVHRYGSKNPRYGVHLSEETKIKLSIAHTGKTSPRKGKKLSAITKQKISETRRKNIKSGKIKIDYSYRIGMPPANKGKIGVSKGATKTYIDETDLQEYLDKGYALGWSKKKARKKKGKTNA